MAEIRFDLGLGNAIQQMVTIMFTAVPFWDNKASDGCNTIIVHSPFGRTSVLSIIRTCSVDRAGLGV